MERWYGSDRLVRVVITHSKITSSRSPGRPLCPGQHSTTGTGPLQIHVVLPPGVQVVNDISPLPIVSPDGISWFNGAGVNGFSSLSGYQFTFSSPNVPVTIEVSFTDSTGHHLVTTTATPSL